MLQVGIPVTQTHVGSQIGVSPSVMHRLSRIFAKTNIAVDRLRTGHPRCTTPAEYLDLCNCALRSRIIGGALLRARFLQVST